MLGILGRIAIVLLLVGCQSAPSSAPSMFASPAPATSLAPLALAEGAGPSVAALAPADLGSPRYAAIVVDAPAGEILHAQDADAPRYPASLTKMMTLYLLFEELERGRLTLASSLAVSPVAAAQPPSKLGLKPGSTIRVEDAIQAIAVKSANDVAVVIAENIAGSEYAFADRMTRTARAIGMRGTVFRNASGLPDPAQVTTARDMALLGRALQRRFPRHYGYFSQSTFAYGGRSYRSTNRLLREVEGVDGIKTGYTRLSGYNLVTSVRRGGRRLIVVVMGERSGRTRDAHVADLVERYLPEARGGLWAASL